jgi:hypothetical protein
MLLRHRAPTIEDRPVQTAEGLPQLSAESVAVLRWLTQSRVEYVVVGPFAHAIRGDAAARGAVAIVPAPYRRNLDRLCRALSSAHARRRVDGIAPGTAGADPSPVKLTPEKLLQGPRWTLRLGVHDLDVEVRAPGLPRYQELLYEAGSFELEPGLKVEVASPEDLEHIEHVHRTGFAPEIKITRNPRTTPAES